MTLAQQLPPLAITVPLVSAAAVAGAGTFVPRWAFEWLSAAVAAATTAVCLALVVMSAHAPIVYWLGGWVPLRGGVAIGIALAIDPIGAGLATLVAALTLAAIVFSWRYFETVRSLYHALLLGFMAAMVAFSLTGDLFDLFVFFELTTVIGFVLAAYRVEEPAPLQGAFNFGIVNTVAAFMVLLGTGLVYGRTGALNLAQIGAALRGHPADGLVLVSFLLLACGYFVKAAIVPFHFWLADAHAVAPTPVCVLFSGVMVEIGLYAVWRVYWTMYAAPLDPHADAVRAVFVTLGVVTALVGALMCFFQHHLKRMLAFSTISHMGLFLIGLGLLSRETTGGSALYVLAHAGVKGSLFLCVGMLAHRFRNFDEVTLRGHGRELPVLGVLYALGGLALAGCPPFGTFTGGEIVQSAAGGAGYAWTAAVFILCGALIGGALLRTASTVFLGWGEPESGFYSPRLSAEREPETEATRAIPLTMWAPAILLLAAGLACGLLPALAGGVERSAGRFADQAYYLTWVLHLGAAAPPAASFVLPGAADVAHGLGAVAGAALLAAITLVRHRLPGRLQAAGTRIVLQPVLWLRRLHTGVANDYVAWLTAGVAALGTVFAVTIR